MLDPKVAKMVSKELEAESIVVFDEAHNIDSVCIEALSVTINDRGLDQATRSLGRLSSEVSRIKATDSQRLQNEYQNLLNGLIDQGVLDAPANDAGLASVSCVNCLRCCTSFLDESKKTELNLSDAMMIQGEYVCILYKAFISRFPCIIRRIERTQSRCAE